MEDIREVEVLVEKSLQGDKLSTARLISFVERGDKRASYILEKIYPHAGSAYYIGITGSPGTGKSTLLNRLVLKFCEDKYSVGVIAVDPSSPFTGGALLGDRIRMQLDHKKYDYFFRSMSAGRVLGGLSRTAKEAARIMDASGRQIIIIETVGIGQSELDIAKATDTVLVILTPDSGDGMQMMKAGLMEIADIFAVNKSDRPGAENMLLSLEGILDQKKQDSEKDNWRPQVYLTTASLNKGIEELYEGIWKHYHYLQQDKRLEKRRKTQFKKELQMQIEREFSRVLWETIFEEQSIDNLVDTVWPQRTDPQAVAQRFVQKRLANRIAGKSK